MLLAFEMSFSGISTKTNPLSEASTKFIVLVSCIHFPSDWQKIGNMMGIFWGNEGKCFKTKADRPDGEDITCFILFDGKLKN